VSNTNPHSDHFQEIQHDLLGLMRRAALEGDQQRLTRLSLGRFPFIILNQPAAIEAVLTDREQIFFKPKMDLWRRLLGDSILTSDGEDWLQSRGRTASLMGSSRVRKHAQIVSRVTEDRLKSWPAGNTIDILQEMRFITLSSIMHSLCSVGEGFDNWAFMAALTEVMEHIQLRETSPPGTDEDEAIERRFMDAVDGLRGSVKRVLSAHMARNDDLVTLLLSQPDFERGGRTMEQACDDVLAHIIAGFESTATALAWTFLLIARHGVVQERLHHEVAQIAGARPPDVPDLNRMPYLRASFAEALRLYPPTWGILRASARAFELNGVRLPKGSCMLACQYTVHRDHRLFEQPDEFVPERWEGRSTAHMPKFAYFPFGGGRHVCLGRRMGQLTAYTIIARVLQRFRVRPSPDHEITPAVHIVLHPSSGTEIYVTPVNV